MTRKLLVNEVQRLDLQKLNRMGVFRSQPNTLRTSTLAYGNREYGSIDYHLIEDSDGPVALRLFYKISNGCSKEKTSYDCEVSLAFTPCYYGGRRWWFICPLQSGQACVHRFAARCRTADRRIAQTEPRGQWGIVVAKIL